MEDEIDIRELVIALWRKKIVILVVTFIFFVIGIVLYGRSNSDDKTISNDKMDSSDETIISNIDDEKLNNKYVETDFIFSRGINKELDGITSTYKLTIDAAVIINLNRFATSESFLNKTLAEMNLTDIDLKGFKDNITIIGNETSDIITLVIAYEDEEIATELSNRIILELTEKVRKLYNINELILIDGPKELNSDEIDAFEEKINNTTNIIVEEGKEDKEVITQDESKVGSKKKVILITVIGFVLACGCVIISELFNDSVKNEFQLEKITNIKNLVRLSKINVDLTEKFQVLRVKLGNCKSILVTSPEKNDGKTFVAENLAKSYARFGKKTLLINTEALLSENINKEMKESKIKNLTILLSNSDKKEVDDVNIEKRLREFEDLYDILIIDSKNCLDDANTLSISKVVKNTILVDSERKTKIENIIKAKNNIENIGGIVLGNVLNNSTKK